MFTRTTPSNSPPSSSSSTNFEHPSHFLDASDKGTKLKRSPTSEDNPTGLDSLMSSICALKQERKEHLSEAGTAGQGTGPGKEASMSHQTDKSGESNVQRHRGQSFDDYDQNHAIKEDKESFTRIQIKLTRSMDLLEDNEAGRRALGLPLVEGDKEGAKLQAQFKTVSAEATTDNFNPANVNPGDSSTATTKGDSCKAVKLREHGRVVLPFRFKNLKGDFLKKHVQVDDESDSFPLSKSKSWPNKVNNTTEFLTRWNRPTAVNEMTAARLNPTVDDDDDERRWSEVTEVAGNLFHSSSRSLETIDGKAERALDVHDDMYPKGEVITRASNRKDCKASPSGSSDDASLYSWSTSLSSLGMGSTDDLDLFTARSPNRSHSMIQRMNSTLRGKCMRIVEDTSPRRPSRRRSRSPQFPEL